MSIQSKCFPKFIHCWQIVYQRIDPSLVFSKNDISIPKILDDIESNYPFENWLDFQEYWNIYTADCMPTATALDTQPVDQNMLENIRALFINVSDWSSFCSTQSDFTSLTSSQNIYRNYMDGTDLFSEYQLQTVPMFAITTEMYAYCEPTLTLLGNRINAMKRLNTDLKVQCIQYADGTCGDYSISYNSIPQQRIYSNLNNIYTQAQCSNISNSSGNYYPATANTFDLSGSSICPDGGSPSEFTNTAILYTCGSMSPPSTATPTESRCQSDNTPNPIFYNANDTHGIWRWFPTIVPNVIACSENSENSDAEQTLTLDKGPYDVEDCPELFISDCTTLTTDCTKYYTLNDIKLSSPCIMYQGGCKNPSQTEYLNICKPLN